MKRASSRYAHLTTLIADTVEEPLPVFDSSVTDDKAITTANFPSAALVHLALDTASMILSDG